VHSIEMPAMSERLLSNAPIAWRPPEPGPPNGPHWKVNLRPLGTEPAKVMGGEVISLSPEVATTITAVGRPLAMTCVSA
jgi:hypothetical protein